MAAPPIGAPLGLSQENTTDYHIDDRKTLCISRPPHPDQVLHSGEDGFADELHRFYSPAESLAGDQLIALKTRLREIHGEDFWPAATEGIAGLLGAQYAFISKRMNFDDENLINLPSLGEPDSCLLGMSIYYCGEAAASFNACRSKYIAYNTPCAHMRHNKVLLIPERLSEIIPDNPNPLPEQPEGYLAVPLAIFIPGSSEPIVFGHFGVMWTANGLARKQLPFAAMEMLLHGLEDIVLHQFREQKLLDDLQPMSEQVSSTTIINEPTKVYSIFSTAASLKPYARSLSHELRTPMQGVVGMLDVMFAQVQEASEGVMDSKIRDVFASLRESIEVVQDSARRAVEAADNVVHAYDMNMKVPEAPASLTEELEMEDCLPAADQEPPGALPTPMESVSPAARGHKRSRSSLDVSISLPRKSRRKSSRDQSAATSTPRRDGEETVSIPGSESSSNISLMERRIAPGIRLTNIRQALQDLVNDVLKVGGRPVSAVAQPIDGGEEIEVRRLWPNGEEKIQNIKWLIENEVPESILVDERDFAGLIYRILHNAFKFTESGTILIHVRVNTKGNYLVITVEDTGVGIPSAFIPNLFKPFSKEDDGITRQSEGLGLGLMVAKGLALRLKGDLVAVRTETDGPNRGTEFQMRIPMNPAESTSRPSTPYGSPSPGASLLLRDSPGLGSPIMRPGLAYHRHSRSSSGASRLGIPPTIVTYGNTARGATFPTHTAPFPTLSAAAAYQADHSSSRMMPPHYPPPGIISPPISISADHIQPPPALRMSPCAAAAAPPPQKLKLAAKLPLSFLVAEDNAVLRRILVRMLLDMGYTRVHEAYDGAEAVRQMERHQQRLQRGEVDYQIDMVLMDLWMPSMNGYQATEQILNLFTKHVPESTPPLVLAVTADVTDEATERVISAGMKGPLTKPYKTKDLERILMELYAYTDIHMS